MESPREKIIAKLEAFGVEPVSLIPSLADELIKIISGEVENSILRFILKEDWWISKLDQVRQEERKRFEAMIPEEEIGLKDGGHNAVQAGLYGFQRGFNFCREKLLSNLSKEDQS